jgi:3alpha(or 20beta)-hydroxysteroid dehydrogenase
MSGRLAGKVAIITGAASGIGAASAERFVREDAAVIIADRDADRGSALAERLGENSLFVLLDVTDPRAWDEVVRICLSTFGRLDILFSNAGIHGATGIERTTRDEWMRVLDVDAYATVLGIQAVVPTMRGQGGGSIITTSSLQGIEADVGLLPYVAAKSAVRGISQAAALELGRDSIRVNTVFPGVFRTPMNEGMPDDAFGFIPLRRADRAGAAGSPTDAAALAVFLASDAACHISGAEIVIDGGKSARFVTRIEDSARFVAEAGRTSR